MRIRPFSPEDRAAVISLHEELQSYERAFRPSRATGRELSIRQVGEYLRMLADPDEDAFLMVADEGGSLVGFVFFMSETEMLERESGQIYIQDIMVTENSRRSGVGSALMDAVRGVMAEKGIRRIDLQVLVGNEDALSFYRKQGFETAYLGLKAGE